jgi:hypothetical protein
VFDLLLQAERRRKANLRQDVTAVVIATGIVALAGYGIAQIRSPEPRHRTTSEARSAGAHGSRPSTSTPNRGRAATHPDVRTSAAMPSAPAASTPTPAPSAPPRVGPRARTDAADPPTSTLGRSATAPAGKRSARSVADSGTTDSGTADRTVGHTIPPRLTQDVAVDVGAWVAPDSPPAAEGDDAASVADDRAGQPGVPTTADRTDLALEADPRDAGAFTIQRLPLDSPSGATPEGPTARRSARRPMAADAAREADAGGRSQGRWRVTAHTAGTHRLRLVAVDVRDSAGHVDTTARRTVATVDVPVDASAHSAGTGARAEGWRTAWQTPAGWGVACLLSFLLGWLFGGRRRGAPPRDADGGVP